MTMIEKVAEALSLSMSGESLQSCHDGDEEIVKEFMDAARSAIEAMREPTITMAVAGSSFAWFEGRTDEIGDTITTWQAMIDSALAS